MRLIITDIKQDGSSSAPWYFRSDGKFLDPSYCMSAALEGRFGTQKHRVYSIEHSEWGSE